MGPKTGIEWDERQAKAARRGFTLIELMIVVAIIGILAAVAIPKFAGMVRKSNEGSTRGNLGAVRSALTIYYGDMEGQYPADLASLTAAGKYLTRLPAAKVSNYHAAANSIILASVTGDYTDAGDWAYYDIAGDREYGMVWVNCTHTDSKGTVWTDY